MKLALILNVVDPAIGGVLIMGDRGTGKSVAVRKELLSDRHGKYRLHLVASSTARFSQVRAIVDLLPDITVVENDPFNSDAEDPALMGAGRSNCSKRTLSDRERANVSLPYDLCAFHSLEALFVAGD